MRTGSIVVTVPPSPWWFREVANQVITIPPMGLLCLAAYLRPHWDVHTYDFSTRQVSEACFREMLEKRRPAVFGVTLFPDSWHYAREMVRTAKELLGDVVTVAGGAFGTFLSEELLQEEPNLDYIVRHEGEETCRELLEVLERGDDPVRAGVRGISGRERGGREIVQTPSRPPIRDLDSLPFCDRSQLDLSQYTVPFSIITSRGCPGNCIFCSARTMHQGYRTRSVGNILEEIGVLIDEHGMDEFLIADDTFTAKPERVIEFCKLLLASGRQRRWLCESRADVVTPELAAHMKSAGCFKVQVGLESAVDEILRRIRKGVTVADVENAIRCFYDVGIQSIVSFMFGHCWDTMASMRRLIDYAGQLIERYNVVAVFAMNTPFPGTYQYEHRRELGLEVHATRWQDYCLVEPCVSTGNFSLDDLRTIYFEAVDRLQICPSLNY